MIVEKAMTNEDILRLNREYTLFSWSVQSAIDPIPMVGGEGVYFWDASGKRYLDFSSQLMNLNIGHQHPKVVSAIQEQASKMCFAHPSFATQPRGLLGEKIASVTPGNLKKTFFCLGGAEANENAIKIARFYTGRHKILARYRAYHGATHGAITLTGDPRRLPAEPAMPGVVHFLDPYCYRCPFGWTLETCHRECISHVEEIIEYEGTDRVAAIIMEGVTGSNGILVPPDDYWPRVREICDRYGILLISDEVMSGWGRTGKWFAVDHWRVVPDIITTAKGVTAGYVPLGVVVVSDPIARHFDDNMFWCGLTYSGHPLACAAGIATLDVYQEDGLIENAANLGYFLGNRLEEIKKNHQSVGDVRYIGLFACVEVVKDRDTKELMPAAKMKEVGNFLNGNGLFTYINSRGISMIMIAPPLCITQSQIDEGLEIIGRSLNILDGLAG